MPPRPPVDRQALLARLLAQKGIRVGGPGVIPRRPPGTPPVLSFAQQRLWFVQHLEPASTAYHLTQAIRLRGPLQVDVLDRAMATIAARHDALRMAFPERDGHGTVVVEPARSSVLEVVDLADVPADGRDAEIARLTHDTFERPFDLAVPPLWRARLIGLGDVDRLLLLCAHHIALDGWSLGLFMRELTALYAAYAAGRPSPLPDLSIDYADYAAWQRARAGQGAWQDDLAWWAARLADVPALELPSDRPRQPTTSAAGAIRRFLLPADLVGAVRELARQEDATPFMVLMAGFQVLLQRQTGQTDFAVGTPSANRERPEIEQAIGLFANMLALRADVSGTPTFRDLIRRTRRTAAEAYAHQEPPFERIVERVQPERTPGRHPIFQVALTLQNTPPARWEIPGVALDVLPPEVHGAKFDLTVALDEQDGGLAGTAEYRTALFDAGTIDRLMERFAIVLRAATTEPDRPVTDLPVLTAAEQAQLRMPSRTAAAPVDLRSLHERFTAQARRTPDAVALTCGDQAIAYGALDARADRLAARLAAAGVRAETRVPRFLDRTPSMIVAILAVLKAGGAYVPIDPAYPADRIAFVLADCGASLLLTERPLKDRLPDTPVAVHCLEDWMDEPAGPAAGRPFQPIAVAPAQAAYVIYTSGSTGQPKGVVVSHANAGRLFDATRSWFDFGPDDVWTLFHSYAFDFSVWEIWGALLFGGRLVVVPYWVSRSVDQFYQLLADEGVTVLNQTPSAFAQLVSYEGSLPAPADLRLRFVVFGGEALELQALAPWFARHGDERPRLVNMYGITETTVHVTYRPITAADVAAGAGSVIGEPIPDLHIVLLDARLNPVPAGATGEIFVGGAGVARGYLGRPGLTAERFVPDPFGPPGAVLYRSGDLARRRSDGDLEYLGRADHQVKIRGFRIELGEIESTLARHPAVAQAVVVSRRDGAGDRLAAYVVPRGTERPSASALRDFLLASLPDYMAPAAFVTLDALPLTPHGKVDRRALPAPDLSATSAAGDEPPATAVERDLADAWAEGLGVPRVGATDNFFALGGDSILSIRVRSLARARGYDFALADLFQHQTVRELARIVRPTEDAVGADGRDARPFALIPEADRAALPADVEDGWPVAALQAGMLFHAELDPLSAAYHDIFSFHLRAAWSETALIEAVAGVMARHAMLRTSLHKGGFSEPLQLVHRHVQAPMTVEDLRDLPAADQEERIAAWMAAERQRRFDWSIAPLLRLRVHRRTDETFQFSLTVHHAILDGWSLSSLLTELFGRYLDGLAGRPPAPLDPPAGSFRDFVALERAAVADPAAQRFWEERLAGAQAPALPARREPRPADNPRHTTLGRLAWDRPVVDRLQAIAASSSTSLKGTLLAVHLHVLAALAAQTDLVTGLISNGRPEEAGADEVLGLFLNTVPLRVCVAGGSWRTLIEAAFAAERELLPWRRYPLAQMQRWWGRRELIETAFNFVHFHVFAPLVGRDDFRLLETRYHEETNFKLFAQFAIDPATGGLTLGITYDLGTFSEEQAAEITGYYQRALDALVADPDGRQEALELLSAAEATRLLDTFNRTTLAHDTDRCLHELFEAAASRTPDATAIIDGHRRLSYRELNRQANRWARALRRRGAGPDVRVGVSLDRSADLVTVLLAILKAGGAYVPLDPAYPAARLAGMAADAAPAFVVTSRTQQGRVQKAGIPALPIEELAALPPSDEDAADVAAGVSPGNVAYLIYTSGSTGRPKAAAIQHRNAVTLADWAAAAFPAPAFAGVLASTSISFDLSVFEIFVTLARGGTIVLAADALALPALPAAGDVTMINTVPSAIAELLRQRAIPSSVRTVLLAGEPLPASLVDALYALGHVTDVYDLYGPSEDTTYSTFGRREPGGLETIGRPVANTRVYLLDDWLRLAPLGSPGVIYIGGEGVARGYWNRSDLTAERFLPDPFAPAPGARMYCTGDLARFTADGRLIFLGRVDQQVKVRGFRIEPGEIVAALERQDAVAEAAVIAREDEPGRRRLVAYVVAQPGAPLDVAALRTALGAALPDYMVPAAWVTLAALPRTPNGKLDRRALPAPDAGARPDETPYVTPLAGTEETLARIWADVLRVPRVGRHDDFFALGGDSILLLQILARARAAGLPCTARQVLRAQTIARLAPLVDSAVEPGTTGVDQAPEGPLPLLPIQRWFFEQDLAEPHHWNQSLLLETRVHLAPDRLTAAVSALVRRHAALRQRFVQDGAAGWTARIDPPGPRDCQVRAVDLRGLPDEAIARAVEEQCAQEQGGIDLAHGPLVRAVSFDLGPDRPGRLFLVVHHLAVDGVSWRVLLEDLLTLYEQDADGSGLPAAGSPLRAWSAALHRRASDPLLQAEAGWWRSVADADAAAATIPVDHATDTAANVAGAAAMVSVDLSRELTSRLLRDVPARQRVRINDLLLAALGDALERWTGSRDHVIHLEGHGREPIDDAVDVTRTVGWFTSLFPFRLTRPAGPVAADAGGPLAWLAAVRASLRALPGHGLGYGILRYLGSDTDFSRRLSAAPVPAVSFNYLGQFDQALDEAGPFAPAREPGGPLLGPRNRRAHLIDVNSVVVGGQLHVDLHYGRHIHARETMTRLADEYVRALERLVQAALAAPAAGPAPEDFALADVSQQELDAALEEIDL
ncbi:MAG: amino acid adenylation domain-containing protein [Acidobacteriota bacterium]|nr:amino acid adenylation domain-containing protein [Acidobacteriota bacterium]